MNAVPRRIGLWLLVLAACIAVVLVSTRVSREMTLWGIAASALILAWLWMHLTRPPSPD
jgi:hypothetical protein